MQLGCVVGWKQLITDEQSDKWQQVTQGLLRLRRIGFDYAELVVPMLAGLSEAEYLSLKGAVEESGVPVPALCQFIPASLPLTGPSVDEAAIREYLERVLPRIAGLGAEVVVVGSGGARRVPEGFPAEQAEEQLVRFLRLAAGLAHPLGITLAIEHLPAFSTNIILSVAEGVALARRTNHPGVQVLVDYAHMAHEGESLEVVHSAGPMLVHAHVADTGYKPPGTGEWDIPGFLAALRQAGYNGTLSIECGFTDFVAEGRTAAAHLRALGA